MAYKKGSEIAIKWATKILLGKLSASLEMSTDAIDVTNDTSAGFKESLPGDLGASVSFSGVYDPAAAVGQGCEDLRADWLAKTTRTLLFGGTVTGDKTTSATAYVSKLSQSAGHTDKAAFDVTFTITGALTFGVSA